MKRNERQSSDTQTGEQNKKFTSKFPGSRQHNVPI